jgi:hypothetical protein
VAVWNVIITHGIPRRWTAAARTLVEPALNFSWSRAWRNPMRAFRYRNENFPQNVAPVALPDAPRDRPLDVDVPAVRMLGSMRPMATLVALALLGSRPASSWSKSTRKTKLVPESAWKSFQTSAALVRVLGVFQALRPLLSQIRRHCQPAFQPQIRHRTPQHRLPRSLHLLQPPVLQPV